MGWGEGGGDAADGAERIWAFLTVCVAATWTVSGASRPSPAPSRSPCCPSPSLRRCPSARSMTSSSSTTVGAGDDGGGGGGGCDGGGGDGW